METVLKDTHKALPDQESLQTAADLDLSGLCLQGNSLVVAGLLL